MGVQYQFTTPVIARQPANRDAQESNTNVPGRQPVIYQHRSPSIYQTTARQPAIQNNDVLQTNTCSMHASIADCRITWVGY